MQRFAYGLCALGLLCTALAFTFAAVPRPVLAADSRSIGTPTPPPSPTLEPTLEPTETPVPTAMAVASPTVAPAATPTLPPTASPTAPPAPPRQDEPEPTVLPTALPTVTPTTTSWRTDISITKQADTTTILPGGRVRFTLVSTNGGERTAYDVVVRDAVPDDLQVIDITSAKGDIVVAGQTVTAYIGELAPGETVEMVVVAAVREDTVGAITNTARITTTTEGDDSSNNTSSVTLTVEVPQRKIAQIQPGLPDTGATATGGAAIEVLAAIAPAAWLGTIGTLCLVLGGVLSMTFWGRKRSTSTRGPPTTLTTVSAVAIYRAPPASPVGPPRLGPALPPPAPPAALPPLTPLDRDDALRDALPGEEA